MHAIAYHQANVRTRTGGNLPMVPRLSSAHKMVTKRRCQLVRGIRGSDGVDKTAVSSLAGRRFLGFLVAGTRGLVRLAANAQIKAAGPSSKRLDG